MRALIRCLTAAVATAVLFPAASDRAVAAPPTALLADTLQAENRATLVEAVRREGDPLRGSNVFHGRQMACTQCHVVGDGAAALGPNLATMPEGIAAESLVAHLVESVLDPSAVVRPAYRGVTILTDEGQSITGLVARETAAEITLRDATGGGREISIPTVAIDERVPAAVSLMPAGLVNLLGDRQQFLDLVAYLAAVATGGPARAAELAPDPLLLVQQEPAAYEKEIDHAAFLADWNDPKLARAAFVRGEKIFSRVCANCHGTLDQPGSLPTAPRFAEGKFKAGSDPYALYRTLTYGNGMMLPQPWMVPSQKYDVIHYLRETFLKDRNPAWYTAITPAYLAGLPAGTSRGPEPSLIEPWRLHDYGPFLAGSFEVGTGGSNIARKGLVVRLDDGAGGVGRGHDWVLYELDTLRAAAFWTGTQFIDWAGINFDGRHGAHPRVAGDLQTTLPTMPGWADPQTGSFADPRPLGRDEKPYGPLPRQHLRFRSLHHVDLGGTAAVPKSGVVLDYSVGDTTVLETPQLAAPLVIDGIAVPVLVRSLSLGPRPRPLVMRLVSEPAAAALVGPAAEGQAGSPAGAQVEVRDGHLDLLIPAGEAPLDLAVAIAAAGGEQLAKHAASLPPPPAPRSLVGRAAPPLWATPIQTSIAPGRAAGPFAVDVLAAPEANPWNAQVRFSGIDFTGPDTAVICSWDGDVWSVLGIAAAEGGLTWRRIASGLFQPLGIKVIDGVIHVGCRDRIVKLVDLNDDGLTDRYDTFNDDHQVTEHFHEFAMGLETDAAGNLYYAKSARHALPAVVPHHGTLLKVTADGTKTEIVATGFRAANGVCVEADGTFWVTDQEGNWNPKNRINHVRPGGFYGNMWGYHDVTDSSDAAMTPPACWITNAFDRSPAELLRVRSEKWAPLDGGLLELSYGEGRVHLVLTEQQGKLVQGGMVALPIPDLPTGIMRGRFNPADGQLYTCGLYAWAGNRQHPGGFFRVRRTDKPLTIPVGLHAEPGRLDLEFAVPLDEAAAEDVGQWTIRAWDLKRTQKYGSEHVNERALPVKAALVSGDGRRVSLTVPELGPTWCYSVAWTIRAADGTPVKGVLHGTLHDGGPRRPTADGLPAAEAARAMSLPPGFSVKLLAADPDEGVRRLAGLVAVRFRDPRIVPSMRAVVADPEAGATARRDALAALVAAKDAGLPPMLQGLIGDSAIRNDVLEALAVVPHDGTPAAIVAGYPSLPADARQAAIPALVSRPAWTLVLLDAIASGSVPRSDLSAFTVGQLARSEDEQVLDKLQAVWDTVRATPADRQAEFAAWRTKLGPETLQKADLSHGRATFAKTCGACHQLHGEGGRIGPDLTGSNRADLEYLLANLLDPSAIVGRDYQTTIIVTDDGRSIVGIVVQETPTSVTLETPTERVTVSLDDIETRVLSPQSLMPENQLAQLSPEAARDLVAYLRHPTQLPLPGQMSHQPAGARE